MDPLLAGIVAACGASALYYTGMALQALEARKVPSEHSLRFSLIQRLASRPAWALGTLLVLLGWPLQAAALTKAPLTAVQPALAAGLLILLAIGVRLLGEAVGRREILGVLAIAGGVGGLAFAAPDRTGEHASAPVLAVALIAVAVAALAPYALHRSRSARGAGGLAVAASAGLAYAWCGLSTKLIADEFTAGNWLAVAFWVAATAVAGGVGVLSESTALQSRPATKVGPVVLVADILVAVILAPVLAQESWRATPFDGALLAASLTALMAGAAGLASSRPVGALMGTDAGR